MSTFLQDFKAFTLKGNVVDMAVGVIIGGAFGKIVSSLVADIIMPPIGLLVGGVNFTELKVIMKEAILDAEGNVVTEAVTWNYGNFIQSLFDFIIIAFSIFMIIRFITKISERNKKEEEEAAAEPAAPSNEEVLLTEIRDLLAKK